MKRLKHPSAAKQAAEKLYFAISHEGARLYRLRKNSILPLALKGHGFSHADKVNQISVGFSHRGTYFRILGETQLFSAACKAAAKYRWQRHD